jgi:Flp pilus assembly pilin Flp
MKNLSRFLGRSRAASMLPYGLVVGLVAVVALLAVSSLGSTVSGLFDTVGDDLDAATTGAGGGGGSGDDEEEGEEGGTPVLAGDPASQTVNQDSFPGQCKPVSFKNTGTGPASGFSAPGLSGGSDYSLSGCSNTCTGTLAAGASCTVGVKGTGVSNGDTLSGTLTLTASAGGSAAVTLSGTAFAPSGFVTTLGGGSYSYGQGVAFDGSGYAVVGYTSDFSAFVAGNDEVLIARFFADGTLDWATSFGTAANGEAPAGIVWDGTGYLVGGSGGSPNRDVFVAHVSTTGDVEWAKRLGGTEDDWGGNVALGGGGYGVAINHGSSQEMAIAWLDSSGTLMWAQKVNTPDWVETDNIASNSSHFLLIGQGADTPSPQLGILASFDFSGNFAWATSIYDADDQCEATVAGDGDGSGWIIAGGAGGGCSANSSPQRALVARLSSTGTVDWARAIGGAGEDYALGVTAGGSGYALAMYSTGYFSGNTAALTRLDSSGNVEWTASLDGIDGLFYAVAWDGVGYVAVGGAESELLIAHFDEDGLIPGCAAAGTGTRSVDGGFALTGNDMELDAVDPINFGQSNAASPTWQDASWSGSGTPPTVTAVCP